MIVVDTSALMAVVLGEAQAGECAAILQKEKLAISAGTVAEALIVSARRNIKEEMVQLIEGLGLEIVSVTQASAILVAEAYARWGKGIHPAGLNFGDCFAYSLAKHRDCKLLFVGGDFVRTDVDCALGPATV